jgi:hypothetical protein
MLRHVARGGIHYSLYQRGIHSLRSAPQLHLVSDAMTGAICAFMCEVLYINSSQKSMMVNVSSFETSVRVLFTLQY